MTSVTQDVRHSLRMLRKHKGFTVVAVLTLALGIGVNTAMFSVLNTFLFRALPYPESDRLVRIFRTSPHSDSWPHSAANFFDQHDQNAVFEKMAAYTFTSRNLAETGQTAERLPGEYLLSLRLLTMPSKPLWSATSYKVRPSSVAWTSFAVSSASWALVIPTVIGPPDVSLSRRPAEASGRSYWLIW